MSRWLGVAGQTLPSDLPFRSGRLTRGRVNDQLDRRVKV